jgi:hypothetical protein
MLTGTSQVMSCVAPLGMVIRPSSPAFPWKNEIGRSYTELVDSLAGGGETRSPGVFARYLTSLLELEDLGGAFQLSVNIITISSCDAARNIPEVGESEILFDTLIVLQRVEYHLTVLAKLTVFQTDNVLFFHRFLLPREDDS